MPTLHDGSVWRELSNLWQSVRDPEYAHLLLESLPLYGLAAGLTFLIVSLVTGEHRSRLLALLVVAASCASVWPYLDLRAKATPRIVAVRPQEAKTEITAQTDLRQETAWAYHLLAVVSSLAALTSKTRAGRYFLIATVVGGMAVFWLSLWLHKKECELYHPNIRRYVAPARR